MKINKKKRELLSVMATLTFVFARTQIAWNRLHLIFALWIVWFASTIPCTGTACYATRSGKFPFSIGHILAIRCCGSFNFNIV